MKVKNVFYKGLCFLFVFSSSLLFSDESGKIAKDLIVRFLPNDPIIIDAGAHDGTDTKELALLWPDGMIYAFEPVPSLFYRLCNRTLYLHNVRQHQEALGSKTGIAIFHVSGGSSDGSSSLLAPKRHLDFHPSVSFDQMIDVNVFTLDDWAAIHDIQKIDLMWLDMQGSELAMLKASPRMLATTKVIYTEVSLVELYEGCPLYDEVKNWLSLQGFEVVWEGLPWPDGGNVLFVRKELIKNY